MASPRLFLLSPRQESNLRPAVYKTQEAGVGQCRPVPESAVDVGFRDSAVSPSACGYRPVSNRTLEDPLEDSGAIARLRINRVLSRKGSSGGLALDDDQSVDDGGLLLLMMTGLRSTSPMSSCWC